MKNQCPVNECKEVKNLDVQDATVNGKYIYIMQQADSQRRIL